LPDVLRVGLLLDDLLAPRWVRRVVEQVGAFAGARVSLVVLNEGRSVRDGRWRRAWDRRHHLLYHLYSHLDRRFLRWKPDPFERVGLGDLLAGVPLVRVRPLQTRHSDRFPEDALIEIGSHNLDVALRFGFRILRGGALQIARHGVWSFHHDDERAIRGGPPCFWEVMEDAAVTGSVLQVIGERLDAGQVLARSWSPTHRRSVARNRHHVYWKSASFVIRVLERLHRDGPEGLLPESSYRPYSGQLRRNPTNRQALPLLSRFAVRSSLDWARDRLTRKQWFLAWRENTPGHADEFFRFNLLEPPSDRFWGDPFPVQHQGAEWIFFEEYRFDDRRGTICAIQVDPRTGRPVGTAVPALSQPHHLSYPHVFEWEGALFMVPESAQARTVDLYRCVRFPDGWRHEATLLRSVRAVDPTIHFEAGKWWLFANVGAEEAAHCHDELFLFHAPAPTGPWTPHRGNPVVSDARCARPAGRLFRWGGNLYRPAQDCSGHYGFGVKIQRVLRLDEEAYVETTDAQMLPEWHPGLLGTHTLNRGPGITAIDGLRRRPLPWMRQP
jgi:hypothetical protein